MNARTRWSLIFPLLLALTGCMPNQVTIKENQFMPVTQLAQPPAQETIYRLRRDDEIEVLFYYHSDLNNHIKIRPDGRISLPLIDEQEAAGLTPGELDRELTRRYRQHLDPIDMTVIVREFSTPKVYVDGAVRSPSAYPLSERLTVAQLIAAVGGTTNAADLRTVLVVRTQDDGNAVSVASLDLTDIDGPPANTYLQANDLVYVPSSAIAQANLWVDQYLSRMMPDWLRVSFPFIYSLNPSGSSTVIMRQDL